MATTARRFSWTWVLSLLIPLLLIGCRAPVYSSAPGYADEESNYNEGGDYGRRRSPPFRA